MVGYQILVTYVKNHLLILRRHRGALKTLGAISIFKKMSESIAFNGNYDLSKKQQLIGV